MEMPNKHLEVWFWSSKIFYSGNKFESHSTRGYWGSGSEWGDLEENMQSWKRRHGRSKRRWEAGKPEENVLGGSWAMVLVMGSILSHATHRPRKRRNFWMLQFQKTREKSSINVSGENGKTRLQKAGDLF